MIDVARTDFVAVPTRDRERAMKFYAGTLGLPKNPFSTDTWVEFKGEVCDSGVCNGAAFQDTEGNGLLLHHRYAPYRDGTEP